MGLYCCRRYICGCVYGIVLFVGVVDGDVEENSVDVFMGLMVM